jgi:spore germination cell wall hydrolase CwlJ-like protein
MVNRTKKRYRKFIICFFLSLPLNFVSISVVCASDSGTKGFDVAAHAGDKSVDGPEEQSAGQESSKQSRIQIEDEIFCLALNIYFEARSEEEVGQLAVGHVVMNRVADRHYPGTACGVVRQGGEERLHRCQFSWWCDGRSDEPLNKKAWLRSIKLAIKVYFGHSEDPTEGALWYHADYANPYWRDTLVLGNKIGQHIFYLKNKQPQYALN